MLFVCEKASVRKRVTRCPRPTLYAFFLAQYARGGAVGDYCVSTRNSVSYAAPGTEDSYPSL